MLENIRVKNLRSLEDTDEVQISPVTVLLGENSSGKSTFLRIFPLLKQSVETNTRSPVLWYGKYVDFGDFDQALTRNNDSKYISIKFGLSVPKSLAASPASWLKFYNRISPIDKYSKASVEIILASRGKDGLTRTSGIQVDLEDNHILIEINEIGKISSIIVNKRNYSMHADAYTYAQTARLLPAISAKTDMPVSFRWRHNYFPEKLKALGIKLLKDYMHGKAKDSAIADALSNIKLGSKLEMLNSFKRAASTTTWHKRTSDIRVDSKSFEEISDLVLLLNTPALIAALDEVLDSIFRRVAYTAPLRATAERYYRSQDLSVAELDAKGENLAMFVRNLSEREKSKLDTWTTREFGFKFDVKYSSGHVTAGIEYRDSGESFNLADMGFGFSQVMPIIVQIWTLLNKADRHQPDGYDYIYLIEQPELHLHPRLQAKLAETLIKAVIQARKNNIKISLILETHSESIINKIGLMTAKGNISKDDANILIFSKKTESSGTKVSFSKYDENGILTNWPYGFFDIEV
ncbi:AAA family ATPase [Metapseudomonas otitidis]|uniref:AAA family ATPase n=1 Tax=Metapseudomonas otitidis TaxID=319939 RepID=UPI003CE822CB